MRQAAPRAYFTPPQSRRARPCMPASPQPRRRPKVSASSLPLAGFSFSRRCCCAAPSALCLYDATHSWPPSAEYSLPCSFFQTLHIIARYVSERKKPSSPMLDACHAPPAPLDELRLAFHLLRCQGQAFDIDAMPTLYRDIFASRHTHFRAARTSRWGRHAAPR